jgi:IclR family transcriptional regulator, acetate operon repressor
MRNTRDYTVESVDNALRLLILLQERESLRLSDAARELDVARSTAHRLLGTMARRGFAVQDERRQYRLGPALVQAPPGAGIGPRALRASAQPYLRELTRRLGETSHLVVREGAQVRFLDSVEGQQALRIGSRVGITLPAHLTSCGKALLAELDRDEIVSLYADQRDSPFVAQLLRTLTAVRRRGYGTNFGESERGVAAVGVRVRGPGDASVAAVTVSAPSLRLPRAKISDVAEKLTQAVRRLERDLRRSSSTS